MPLGDALIQFLEQGGIRGALGMEPDYELKAGAIPGIGQVGQSTFQLLAAPIIDQLGHTAGNKLGEYIESDEEFQTFRKENPELASKLLTVAKTTPTALAGFLTAIRGLNRSAGGIRANQPGQARELMKKMRESSPDSVVDDLIKLGGKTTPQKETILNMGRAAAEKANPKNIDDALEVFLRR